MADKDIIIGLKTVGAEASARDINKVPDAIDEIPKATNSATAGIDDLIAKLEKMKQRADALSKDAKQTGEAGMAAAAAQIKKEQDKAKGVDTDAALQSLGRLRGRITLVAAAFGTIAAVSKVVFGQLKTDMEAATDAGSKWESNNIKLAATIQALGDPIQTVKDGWKSMANTAIGWIDKIVLKGELANKKQQEDAALTARSEKTAYEQRAAAHAAMAEKILNAEIKLQEARDNLARAREQRANVKPEQAAANEVARIIQKQAAENKIITDALAEAQRAQAAALTDLKNLDLSNEAKEASRKIYDDAKKRISELSLELGYKIQSDALAVQNSVEAAQAEAKQALEEKLTSNAQKLQETLQAIITEKGGAAQAGTELALKTVNSLLENGKVTVEEATRLNSAAVQFEQSSDSNTAALRETTQKLLDSGKKAVDDFNALNQQVVSSAETQQGKLQEVSATLAADRANTVQAIQQLAPQPQDKAAVTGAVQEVGKGITEMGNAFIAALAQVTALCKGITAQAQNQQAQINQIFGRLR